MIPSRNKLLIHENQLHQTGYHFIGGIDEAGRGPLAGPVVSACVVFSHDCYIDGVYDSKSISEKKRETLFDLITDQCISYGIGIIDNLTIDQINIYQATKLSMLHAISNLKMKPDYLLVDAMKLESDIPSLSLIKGDRKSFSIAAASIIAKVCRDRMMRDYHHDYPVYGWNTNKGYPTKHHREAIIKHGFSPLHRKSFSVKDVE